MSSPLTTPGVMPLDANRIRHLIAQIGEGLVERDDQARCLVLAVLCGEHALFIGPPGTAKSELARRLHRLVGGRYFERLLTRFTVPEELFGPLSLNALDEGRYERLVEGYLPSATVAFLDEVFKANSAILNALLTLLNERMFDQGAARMRVPLVTVIAASNESPQDEALRAFQDRFLLRCPVAPVSDAGFAQLLATTQDAYPEPDAMSLEELEATRRLAGSVSLPDRIRQDLLALRALLQRLGASVSDRRWVRIVHALKVAAITNGRSAVDLGDLWPLPFMVCETPEQFEPVRDWLAGLLGASREVEPQWLARVVEAFDRQIELEASAAEIAFDDSGKLALARSVGGASSEEMAAAAPRLSAFSRAKRYGASHIRARLAQIDAYAAQVDAFLARGAEHEHRVAEALRGNLWVPDAFVTRVMSVLQGNRDRIGTHRERLAKVRQAFAELPLSDRDDGRVPAEVSIDAG